MSSRPSVVVDHLSKQYRIGKFQDEKRSIRQTLTAPLRRTRSLLRGQGYDAVELGDTMWALKDLSFEIKRGEAIGIIGPNGAGKSTLLKVLSRITEPSEGYADIYGRVGSLLEVGTGFHPDLTGRENVYLNAAILGMKHAEIDRKFDEIVQFSGVEGFLDTPVKHYSSGMLLRLGFAVATHLDPEILIVDEVLAVGDADFQKRSMGKMTDVAHAGRTVLFVSHNMPAVARICARSILLRHGRVEYIGDTLTAIGKHLGVKQENPTPYVDLQDDPGWEVPRRRMITWVSTHREDGTLSTLFNTGDTLVIRVGYKTEGEIPAYCQLNFTNFVGDRVMVVRTSYSHSAMTVAGEGYFECTIRDLRLTTGDYAIMLDMGREFPVAEWIDCINVATQIRVEIGGYLNGAEVPPANGQFAQLSEWSVIPGQPQ